jgi:tRNA-dihydrouridine synthase B
LPLAVPLAVQVFGSSPQTMAEAAAVLVAEGAALIDINAGCPVAKVVRHGAGASLLRDPERLLRIVAAVRKEVAVPLTVKCRIGWDERSIQVVDLAGRLAAAGVDAITIHGRTAVQHYGGRADWKWIERVKRQSSIPIIGNGDVRSLDQANRLVTETACDGIMIGRASMGNPWLFAAIADGWGRPCGLGAQFGWADFWQTAHEHLVTFLGTAGRPLGHLKKLVVWYSKGCPGAGRLRAEVMAQQDVHGVLARFGDWARELNDLGEPFYRVKVMGEAHSWSGGRVEDGMR